MSHCDRAAWQHSLCRGQMPSWVAYRRRDCSDCSTINAPSVRVASGLLLAAPLASSPRSELFCLAVQGRRDGRARCHYDTSAAHSEAQPRWPRATESRPSIVPASSYRINNHLVHPCSLCLRPTLRLPGKTRHVELLSWALSMSAGMLQVRWLVGRGSRGERSLATCSSVRRSSLSSTAHMAGAHGSFPALAGRQTDDVGWRGSSRAQSD